MCALIPPHQEMPRKVDLNGEADSHSTTKRGGERRWVSSFLHFTFYRVSTSYDGSGRQEDGHTLSPQTVVLLSALVQ